MIEKKYTAPICYDEVTGDSYIEFPQELLDQVGWQIGTDLIWIDNGDGSWTLKKRGD